MIAGFRVFLLIIFIGLFILGLLGASLGHAQGPSQDPIGLVIKVDGIINGVKTNYISRAILKAQELEGTLVVIEIDTPGGFLDSTRDIVEVLLESPLPVAVYVSPRGARAGSAGTFITTAGHFAAMDNLPERLKGRRYYQPGDQGYEREVSRRLKKWWGEQGQKGDAAQETDEEPIS